MPKLGTSSFGDVISDRTSSTSLNRPLSSSQINSEPIQETSPIEHHNMNAFDDDNSHDNSISEANMNIPPQVDTFDDEPLIENSVPAVALFDFEPNADDEVELKAGDKVEVLVQNEGGWWEGRCNGKIGLFPSNYVKLM